MDCPAGRWERLVLLILGLSRVYRDFQGFDGLGDSDRLIDSLVLGSEVVEDVTDSL